jgi:hypothetical protein
MAAGAQTMSWLRDFAIFCDNEKLDRHSHISRRAFETGATSITIGDGRALTMEDIDALTGGLVGQFSVCCPYCGFGKQNLKIERPSLSFARWVCFYCGRSGEVRAEGPIDRGKEAEARRRAIERENEERSRNLARALRIWENSERIKSGDRVHLYLNARGIFDLPPNVDEVLRFNSLTPFGAGARPCLIGLMRDVLTDEPRAIHRTALNEGVKSPPRRTLGPLRGAAVKLWPLTSETLAVGEGIETVLAAATRLKWREPLQPAWALTVANNVARFPIIERVKHLRILVDNDESGVGPRKSNLCAVTWRAAGRDVILLTPKEKGADFNDVIVRGTAG